VLRAHPDVPYDRRIQTARLLEDLTASYQGGWYSVISLHGGGSPAAMKQAIWRHYPLGSKVQHVERLLERGVLRTEGRPIAANRQPGRCCDAGCTKPGQAVMVALPDRLAAGGRAAPSETAPAGSGSRSARRGAQGPGDAPS
jgi:4-hydroxybutyryl-CoA dehydratase/vinylacetyl-CoA-Delta-isomerase